MKKIIIEIGCFLSMPLISNPFLPIAISPDLAALDARPSPWDAPYSLAADAGKSDLCGRMERDDCVSL